MKRCARACARACARVCARVCMRVRVCACVRVRVWLGLLLEIRCFYIIIITTNSSSNFSKCKYNTKIPCMISPQFTITLKFSNFPFSRPDCIS